MPRPYVAVRSGTCAVGVLYTSRFSDQFFGQWLLAWHPWGRDGVNLPSDSVAMPKPFRYIHACLQLRPEHWHDMARVRGELEIEGHKSHFVAAFLAHLQGVTEVCQHISQRGLAWKAAPRRARKVVSLCPEQLRVHANIVSEVKSLQGDPDHLGVAVAVLGAAGTGKSALLNSIIEACVADDIVVGVTSFTGALSDVYRREFIYDPCVRVDTVDGFFRYSAEASPQPYMLLDFSVLIVDEIGLVNQERFDFMMQCWFLAGRRCVLVFAGDFEQGTPIGSSGSARSSPYWNGCRFRVPEEHLKMQWRMGNAYLELITPLRFHRPTTRMLDKLTRGRVFREDVSGWIEDCRSFYKKFPTGVLLVGRRSTLREVNERVLDVFQFRHRQYVSALDVQGDSTYDLRVALGCRLLVIMNMDKTSGVVNGVFGYLSRILRHALVIQLDSGCTALVTKRPTQCVPHSLGYPVVLGYACTVAKMQGRTLDAIALELDVRQPGFAYTALSRIRSLVHLYWLRRPCVRDFFTANYSL